MLGLRSMKLPGGRPLAAVPCKACMGVFLMDSTLSIVLVCEPESRDLAGSGQWRLGAVECWGGGSRPKFAPAQCAAAVSHGHATQNLSFSNGNDNTDVAS